MNQHLVNYTVRNIITGDGEDERILELGPDELGGFPEEVRDQIQWLIDDSQQTGSHWDGAQETMLDLLLPYISERELFDASYPAWEQNVLEGSYEPQATFPPAPGNGHIRLWLSGRQWSALQAVVAHAADEVHACAGMATSWGPFGLDDEMTLEEADESLAEVAEALQTFADNNA